jgi:hypothetical protein
MFEIVSHQINAIDFLLEVISSVASNSNLTVDDYLLNRRSPIRMEPRR